MRLKVSPLRQKQVLSDLKKACHWEKELLHGGEMGPKKGPDLKKQGIQMFEY